MDQETKRPSEASACAQVWREGSRGARPGRTLSVIIGSPRGDVLESAACVLAKRNIASPVRLRDTSLEGLLCDLERANTLGMRALVLLDAEAALATQLSQHAHAAGIEPPIVVLLGEDHGELHRTLSPSFTFDEFRALISRVGCAWQVG